MCHDHEVSQRFTCGIFSTEVFLVSRTSFNVTWIIVLAGVVLAASIIVTLVMHVCLTGRWIDNSMLRCMQMPKYQAIVHLYLILNSYIIYSMINEYFSSIIYSSCLACISHTTAMYWLTLPNPSLSVCYSWVLGPIKCTCNSSIIRS